MTKESEVPRIYEKPDKTVLLEKGLYCVVFVLLNFIKEKKV